jgi:nitroreductase
MFDDSLQESWRRRYGEEPEAGVPDLGSLLTHRSVRDFEPREISEATIVGLIAAAQSAATSSNLQLWSTVSIQDPKSREQIAMLCGDQHQVREAAWFFAFLADHHRIRHAAEAHGELAEGLDYTEFYTMAVIDAALAAERMVCAAESLGIGVCYIGGLRNDAEGVRQMLKLPDGVFGLFGLCLGWPKEESGAEIKPRLSQEAVWFRETYNTQPNVSEYDDRMKAFYEEQKMRGDVTWSMRSARRVGPDHLTGRQILKTWLEERGFNRR